MIALDDLIKMNGKGLLFSKELRRNKEPLVASLYGRVSVKALRDDWRQLMVCNGTKFTITPSSAHLWCKTPEEAKNVQSNARTKQRSNEGSRFLQIAPIAIIVLP
jgi:hypothetical protein